MNRPRQHFDQKGGYFLVIFHVQHDQITNIPQIMAAQADVFD
jgi:hypothetical protein